MTLAWVRPAIALAAAVAALSGCGDEQSTTLIEEHVVGRRDVARLTEGSPEQAALKFARFVQSDDPVATESMLSERWGLSVNEVAASLRTAAGAARQLRVSRIVRTMRRGGHARVKARLETEDARLDLVRERGSWKIDRLRIATIDLPGDRRRRP